jgi:hypothetical protein
MRRARTPQMMARESAKGGEGIVDFNRGKTRGPAAARDQRSPCATPRRLCQVCVAVAIGTSKRHEQSAGAERARVVRHSANGRLGRAEHFAAGCGGNFVEPEGALVIRYRRRHRRGRAGRGQGS